MLSIASIVEGHGEVEALPIVIRRILAEARPSRFANILQPIRKPRDSLLKANELEKAIELAARKTNRKGAIVVVLDSDGEPPCQLGPELLKRAVLAAAHLPVRVVLAHCEWEAWYLAAAVSLSGRRGLKSSLLPPNNPEAIRGAKEWLRANMDPSRTYSPAIDQSAFANMLDLEAARTAPSFAKLCRDILSLPQEDRPS
ncbi:MAG: DUF4276 family protein [Bryobacteraceae bacterium]